MRTPGPVSHQILQLLDPGSGGVFSANYEYLQARLSEKGAAVGKAALYNILKRLIDKGEVERVPTEDGGAVYTRPSILLNAPGLASILPDAPALKVRQRSSTSEQAYQLRSKKAVRRWQDKVVARGNHDHRDPNRPCPVKGCWAWPPAAAEAHVAKLEHQNADSSPKVHEAP